MPINTTPIYSRVADVTNNGSTGMNQLVTAAAANYDGTSANNSLVFTADATYGGFLQRLRFKSGGSNVATVARIFINNGSANTSAANNVFYGEVSLAATTATNVAATAEIDYPMNLALPPGFRIYFGLATAVASGWVCTPVGGKY